MRQKFHEKEQERFEEYARNAAKAEPSDPFIFDRAISQLKSGVAGYRYARNGAREDAVFDAKPTNAVINGRRQFRQQRRP